MACGRSGLILYRTKLARSWTGGIAALALSGPVHDYGQVPCGQSPWHCICLGPVLLSRTAIAGYHSTLLSF